MRRHIVPIFAVDFDSRPRNLTFEINEEWDDKTKRTHWRNHADHLAGLTVELGPIGFADKLERFEELGALPFSIVSYHNYFLRQIRQSYVQGNFYPALTGACALGERILNHLVLDLREDFQDSPQYKTIGRLRSVQSWQKAINALNAWEILLPAAESEFRKLETLRQRSIHFDPKTYGSVRIDALTAIKRISNVVDMQFSGFGLRPWFIEGTKGACFIKQAYETNSFIRKFYLPLCPAVGLKYAYSRDSGHWRLFDCEKYERTDVSDGEFCRLFNERDPGSLVPTDYPPKPGIVCYELGDLALPPSSNLG